jgi:ribonuclease HI
LIQAIDTLIGLLDITFQHVYGHVGNKYNEIADKYAKIGTDMDGYQTIHLPI